MEMIGITNTIVAQHSFKHKWQLRQLQSLDKPAYAKTTLLLKYGLFSMAEKHIKAAMNNALIRLTSPPSFDNITQIINEKQQWHSGEVKDLWISGCSSSLHIRNEGGCLNALFITEGKTLMDRKTETLQVGYLDPKQGQWKIISKAQNDYNKIIMEKK